MFGYVTAALNGLSKQEQERYKAAYCGLCKRLKEKYGQIGRITLSYDMTFLYLLLTSLYEPAETTEYNTCLPHPIHKHPEMVNDFADYCADMNILLCYYKALDDWKDEHKLTSMLFINKMKSVFCNIESRYPEKAEIISNSLKRISEMEQQALSDPDVGANETGKLLGVIYRYSEDIWSDLLQKIGEGLGRFIYLMDAYDDLPKDIKTKQYNPLIELKNQERYEDFIKQSLTLFIAETTEAFELLPLEKDLPLLRNILYAGCWTRYESIIKKKEQQTGIRIQNNKG